MKALPWRTYVQRWQQPESDPASSMLAVEDSLWLRVVVQTLVSVGILATDVAAGSLNSVWAIPLSALGATWSWHNRRRRNLAAKFGIAVGMLGVLGFFLARLLGNSGDSRLLLADLLIQLQVLHTFDLPRRKDLGYSAVIGLILLGVAATISETMLFGGFLILFVAIALPVLLLDYRSRMGLGAFRWRQGTTNLPARRLAILLGSVLALGLLIFAVTPRLPGYQFRTLPVSGEVAMQGRFDPKQIFNPGVRKGRGNRGGATDGQTMNQGQGIAPSLSATTYYGFQSEVDQTLTGVLKPKEVMRVRSQSKGFWRVMAFDRYTGRGWTVSRNAETNILRRLPWSYRFLVPSLQPLGRTKEIVQSFSILTEFPNLLPALTQAREIYFPTAEIGLDAEGGLRSPGALDEGLTYSVVSDVPYRDRTRLNRAKTTYPKSIQKYYLQVPETVAPRLRQKAEQLLAKAERPVTTPYEKALYLTQSLKQTYPLREDYPLLPPGKDLATAFLFDWQGGERDHFATALTLMLRSLGIPARLATGFAPGEFNPFTGLYVVKNTDAYALTEVYIPGNGWFAFDPIPGHELYPPSIEVDQTFSVLQQFWNWIAGWLPSPIVGWIGGVFAFLGDLLAKLLSLFSQGWVGFLKLCLLLSGIGLGLWGSWQLWQRWRTLRQLHRLAPMARLYQKMLHHLVAQGFQKHPSETPLEYAQQIQQSHPGPAADIIVELSHTYAAWQYGRITPDLTYLQQRWQTLRHYSFH
jgi:transglutaminase-like putative cysteine protease